MTNKENVQKGWLRKGANFLFFGLLLLVVLLPSAKAWLLRGAMAVGLFKADIKNEAPAAVAAPVPAAFSYTDATGATVSTGSLRGKVVFINFWATWCPPCRAEMPALNELYGQFRDDEAFVFLFLNEDEDKAKAAAYLKEGGFSLPLQSASGGIPPEIYSGTLPTTVVLNKEGKVVYKHEGLANYNSPAFIQQLKALL